MWCLLVFGVYLNASMCEFFGIYSDMWMQDRYYKNYGVITGFIDEICRCWTSKRRRTTLKNRFWSWPPAWKRRPKRQEKPLYKESYAATADAPEQRPNIIFVMNEIVLGCLPPGGHIL